MSEFRSETTPIFVSVYDPAIIRNHDREGRTDESWEWSYGRTFEGLSLFQELQFEVGEACQSFGIKACAVVPEVSANHLECDIIFELRYGLSNPTKSINNQQINLEIWVEDLLKERGLLGVVNFRLDGYQRHETLIERLYGIKPTYR